MCPGGDPAEPGSAPKQERSRTTRRRLLDAAVDELVEHGYAKLTTSRVAARAGVSRGAQQHHFPDKTALVADAVQHLAQRQMDELEAAARDAPAGRERVARVLDLTFDQYSGPLFATMLELMLAARDDPPLRESIVPAERAINRAIHQNLAELYSAEAAVVPDFDDRLRHALSATRGLALLKLLRHPDRAVRAQWSFTRPQLLRILTEP